MAENSLIVSVHWNCKSGELIIRREDLETGISTRKRFSPRPSLVIRIAEACDAAITGHTTPLFNGWLWHRFYK